MKERGKKTKKYWINLFLIETVVILLIWIGITEYKENDLNLNPKNSFYQVQNLSTAENTSIPLGIEEKKKEEKKQYPKESIPTMDKGYLVAAKLQIPAISLETYILKPYSLQALNRSVTKFWGPDPNTIGNFCIAGHNFQNKNMFYNLKKLKIGDNLSITDQKIGKVEYKVNRIYTVLPEDVSCLDQETQGKKEVTLITCTYDSQKRIIVKAIENE